jgi:hypothetical protein
MDFRAPLPARRTLDFALFGVACFVVFLREGLALALPRLTFSCASQHASLLWPWLSPVKYAAGKPISKQANYADIISQ